MTPTTHPSNNVIFTGDADNVFDVQGTKIEYEDGTPACLTFWKPTPEELAMLNANGTVIITVLGERQPPIMPLVAGVGNATGW